MGKIPCLSRSFFVCGSRTLSNVRAVNQKLWLYVCVEMRWFLRNFIHSATKKNEIWQRTFSQNVKLWKRKLRNISVKIPADQCWLVNIFVTFLKTNDGENLHSRPQSCDPFGRSSGDENGKIWCLDSLKINQTHYLILVHCQPCYHGNGS